MPVFSTDVVIGATVYIQADSAEQAAEKLQKVDTGLEFSRGGNYEIDISGARLDSDDFPDDPATLLREAAPDLLAALKRVEAAYRRGELVNSNDAALIGAVIAMAEGRDP